MNQQQQFHHDRYIADISNPIAESRTGRILSAIDRMDDSKNNKNNKRVALKFVFVPNSENNGLSHAQLRETAVWGLLSAYATVKEEEEEEEKKEEKAQRIPILKLIDVFSSGASVVYVSKQMKSDLHTYLLLLLRQQQMNKDSNNNSKLNLVKHLLRQILLGVDFMHRECNVIHRDLKPHNIFIDYDDDDDEHENNNNRQLPRVFIGDFGLSRCCAEVDPTANNNNNNHHHHHHHHHHPLSRPMTHEVVSRAYRAPELLLGCGRVFDQHHHSIDMWSVGCIAVDLVAAAVVSSSCSCSEQQPSPPPSLFASSSGSDLEQLSKIYDLIGTPTQQVQQQKLLKMMMKGGNHVNTSTISNSSSSNQNSFFVSFTPRSGMKNWSLEIAKCYIPQQQQQQQQREHFADFIRNLLCNDPTERMTAQQCLQHPFINMKDVKIDENTTTHHQQEETSTTTTGKVPWFANSKNNSNSSSREDKMKMEQFLRHCY